MSSHQHSYIGPYLVINQLPTTQANDALFTCSNKKCSIHGKKAVGKFCSNCGATNTTINKTKQVNVSANELMYEFGKEDLLFTPGDNILLPNRRNMMRVMDFYKKI